MTPTKLIRPANAKQLRSAGLIAGRKRQSLEICSLRALVSRAGSIPAPQRYPSLEPPGGTGCPRLRSINASFAALMCMIRSASDDVGLPPGNQLRFHVAIVTVSAKTETRKAPGQGR